MLISYIYINKTMIDAICMHNQGLKKDGKFLYKVWKDSDRKNIKEVWHKREDGWEKLLSLSLKKLGR
jgi:hypothetical protein